MAFVDKIVESINATLKVVLSSYKHKIEGVCDVTDDGNERLYLRTLTGESFAAIDDSYEIVCFHVAPESTYRVAEQQFGESDDMYESETQIQLIGYAYSGTMLNNRTFSQLLLSAIPSSITLANQSDSGLYSTVIEITESNYKSTDVFNQLYAGVEYSVPPKDCLVSVRYTVTSLINRTCLPQCLNC